MIAEIIVDVTSSEVDKVFDYICDENYLLGQRVLVPFGNRKIEGYIINVKDNSSYEYSKLKSVIKPLDDYAVITKEMLELSRFMIKKYNLRIIDTLRLFLPAGIRGDKVKISVKKSVSLNDLTNIDKIRKNAKNQLAIIDYLKQTKVEDLVSLNNKFGNESVKKLLELNIIKIESLNSFNSLKTTFDMTNRHILNKAQQDATNKICSENSKVYLLYGVTGSGKTEVYMNSIEKVLMQGKTAIMLVPEIGLTPQVMKNFVSRFGETVAILHSGLSLRERFDEWHRILIGDAKIVVGARSAIFAPAQNLGLIVIDEEHDTSYYSESNPRYSTHEVAKFRANYNKCNLVLGSATPSIDSFYKAKMGEYELIELPTRVNGKDMPALEIVDMCSEIRNGNGSMFSTKLLSAMKETIASNNQVLLFLNRRGYSSFIRCTECGYVAKCEDCDVSLVYHKEDDQLKCHFCGRRYHTLTNCPSCGSDLLRQGAIGTQKVVEELKKHFKDVKIFRMDNDTAVTKDGHISILDEFAKTKPSILVGTQMIAKGHDFPSITLVGIIDADLSLHFADFRAQERAFQLITQVAGRAGRSEKEGKVILQTYCPKHFVYRTAKEYNYDKFFEKEINLRKVTKFPPFSTIVRVLITCEDEQKLIQFCSEYAEKLVDIREKYANDFIYYNFMKSPVKRIQNKFRYQILMRLKKGNDEIILQEIYKIDRMLKNKNVLTFVEINPQSLS